MSKNDFKGDLDSIVAIMDRLRSPGGCPWDREQDYKSLVPYVIEEAYEVVSAIDIGTPDDLKEELGDLLFQIIFLCRLAKEDGHFDIADVISGSIEKMVRRHPHVFEDTVAETADEVVKNWVQIKDEEKKKAGTKGGYLSDIPEHFPALMRAHKVSKKASRTGFDWKSVEGVLEKVSEELGEFKEALIAGDSASVEEELGDLLFSVVNVGRFVKVDPEEALRKTTIKFIRRFHYIEKKLGETGCELSDASIEEMESLWKEAKREERKQEILSP